MSLPLENRFIIWRLSLPPYVVEILAFDIFAGFYSQAALLAAMYVCWELRQVVEAPYLAVLGLSCSLKECGSISISIFFT
jgi:hypothetical protein